MANELRRYYNAIGGLVEDNPLAAAATTLTSSGLAALAAVGSTEHVVVVFDPDGLTGAPFGRRVTAHTAGATTATIEAAAIWGTARQIDRDTPWVHTMLAEDATGTRYSKPTHGVTRASTTLGSLSTAWTDTATTVHADQIVEYDVAISAQCAGNEVIYVALTRGGTIIDRAITVGAGNIENRIPLSGWDAPGSAGTFTYEIYVASNAGSTITVNATPNTSTAISQTSDGVSSMRLRPVWRG